jgi:hypothetical protein
MYSENCSEVSVLLRRWCDRWNIKINEEKTRAIYVSHRLRPSHTHLTMNGQNITFVKLVKYLGVVFDKRITWRLHIEVIEAKAFRTFIRIYSLFKSERLNANIKLSSKQSSGILRRVLLVRTDVSEERIASIFRVGRKNKRNSRAK